MILNYHYSKLGKSMVISYSSQVLRQIVNTWFMDTKTSPKFTAEAQQTLCSKWGLHQKTFVLQGIDSLTRELGHITSTKSWLRFLLSDLFSLMYMPPTALQPRFHHQQVIPYAPQGPEGQRHTTYLLQACHSQHSKDYQPFMPPPFYHKNLKSDLVLITDIIDDLTILRQSPITHSIPRDPSEISYSNSSSHVTGEYLESLQF